MDVIRIFNGLGNQMSQYAFYLSKKRRHPYQTCWVYMPDEWYKAQHNGYELDRVFGIKRNFFIEKILYRVYAYSETKDWRKNVFGFISNKIIEKNNSIFTPQLLDVYNQFKLSYYFGGWHSEKYFKTIRQELLRQFRFNDGSLNLRSSTWAEIIKKNQNSCSIHVRRGDFLKHRSFCGIASEEYYQNAITTLRSKTESPIFYVFSDDISWCKDFFGERDFNYIDCNHGLDSWQDMYLMTICHHHINANSTFSWWGAWLCQYDNSITIVPSRFKNDCETPDFYPESWIKI